MLRKKNKLKFLLIFLFLLYVQARSQTNSVTINKTGDKSKVIIVQNGDYKVYHLDNRNELNKLINVLSKLSDEFKSLFKKIQTGQEIQYKILKEQKNSTKRQYELKKSIDSLSKNILNGLLDTSAINILTLETHIKELQKNQAKLEEELSLYKKNNPSFNQILDSAQNRLRDYDFYGYHKIMESFIESSIKNASSGCYLRSKTYSTNFQFNEALVQMERAHTFDSANPQIALECVRLSSRLRQFKKLEFYSRKALAAPAISNDQKIEIFETLGIASIWGDPSRSIGYLDSAFALISKSFAKDTVATLIKLILLQPYYGDVMLSRKNYKEAIDYFNKSIFLARMLVRYPENILTAITYSKIADAYSRSSLWDSAVVYYTKSYMIYEKHSVKDNHKYISEIYENLAFVSARKQEPEKAVLYYEKALDLYNTYSNNNDPKVGTATYNAAMILFYQLKQPEKAKSYFLRARKILSLYGGYRNLINQIDRAIATSK